MEDGELRFSRVERKELRDNFNLVLGKNFPSITKIRQFINDQEPTWSCNTIEQAYRCLYNYLNGEAEANVIPTQINYNINNLRGNIKLTDNDNDTINHQSIYERYEDAPIGIYGDYDEVFEPILKCLNWLEGREIAISVNFIGTTSKKYDDVERTLISTPLIRNDIDEIVRRTTEYLKKQELKPSIIYMFYAWELRFIDIKITGGGEGNCLFDCINEIRKPTLKLIKNLDFKEHHLNKDFSISTNKIKAIRKEYNLKSTEKISMEQAYKIAKDFGLNITFCVERELRYIELDTNQGFKILVKDEHFSVIHESNKNNEVIHFDIETFVKEGQHIGFIIGFAYEDKYEILAGDDCLKDFYELMGTQKFNRYKYLNAYNGAGFDYHLILKEMLKYETIETKDIIVANGRILMCDFQGKKLVDLNQHISGNLRTNLKEYGCSMSKGEIDYSKFKRWNEMDNHLQFEILEYLKADVLGLKELYEKVNNASYENFGRNVCEYMTSSQMYYDICSKDFIKPYLKNSNKPDIFPSSIVENQELRESVKGGRTEVYRRYYKSKDIGKRYNEIEDYMLCLDKNSLYPSVMAKFEYPIGKRKNTNFFNIEKLGIYYISYIAPKDILYSILPRHEGKSLVWDLNNCEGWYSSIDIKNAIDWGYKISVIRGFYWEDTGFIFKDYIETLYAKKAQSIKGSTEYQMYKIAMNAIYGKQLQKDNIRKTLITSKLSDVLILMKTNDVWVSELGNKSLVEYEPIIQDGMISKKPIEIGSFILAYSRKEMLEVFKKFNTKESLLYYTDTDSIFVEKKYIDKTLIGKEMGQMSNDFKDAELGGEAKILEAHFIAPKLYSVMLIYPNNEVRFECIGKGVQNKLIKYEDYERLASGESIDYVKDFQMKRNGLKKGLGIKHILAPSKCIKKNTDKRYFVDNYSIPLRVGLLEGGKL